MAAWNKGHRKDFNLCYIPVTESGCWIWTSSYDADGYGKSSYNKYAHRLSYELFISEIPSGLCVLHKCDVRCCVNPNHLFVGTNQENTADRTLKGRSATGSRNGAAKLTESDAIAIFNLNGPYREIAKKYGVTHRVVSLIKRKLMWKLIHVAA